MMLRNSIAFGLALAALAAPAWGAGETASLKNPKGAFEYADRNGDGVLSASEFRSAMTLQAEMFGEGERSKEKRNIFYSLDTDGNAVISKKEAERRPGLAKGFDRIDTNRNGTLDMGEFAEISLSELAAK